MHEDASGTSSGVVTVKSYSVTEIHLKFYEILCLLFALSFHII